MSFELEVAISMLQRVAQQAHIPVEGLECTFIHREADGVAGIFPGKVLSIQRLGKKREKLYIQCSHPGKRGGASKSASKFLWDEQDKMWRKVSSVWGSEVVLGTSLGGRIIKR